MNTKYFQTAVKPYFEPKQIQPAITFAEHLHQWLENAYILLRSVTIFRGFGVKIQEQDVRISIRV